MFNNNKQFFDMLHASLDAARDHVVERVKDSMSIVENTSQSYVPIKTGATRDSWFADITIEKNTITGVFGYDKQGKLSHYVPLIHAGYWPDGTEINFRTDFQGTPRREFLKLGYLQNEPEIIKRLGVDFSV